jgi:hypothetical protein
MAANEATVQVNSGGGPKVRNLELLVQQSDGTLTTVYMQVVSIADSDGNLISLRPAEEQRDKLLQESRIQTELLMRILAAIEPGEETSREEILQEIGNDPALDEEKETLP